MALNVDSGICVLLIKNKFIIHYLFNNGSSQLFGNKKNGLNEVLLVKARGAREIIGVDIDSTYFTVKILITCFFGICISIHMISGTHIKIYTI